MLTARTRAASASPLPRSSCNLRTSLRSAAIASDMEPSIRRSRRRYCLSRIPPHPLPASATTSAILNLLRSDSTSARNRCASSHPSIGVSKLVKMLIFPAALAYSRRSESGYSEPCLSYASLGGVHDDVVGHVDPAPRVDQGRL